MNNKVQLKDLMRQAQTLINQKRYDKARVIAKTISAAAGIREMNR